MKTNRLATLATSGLAAIGGLHIAAGVYWAVTRPLPSTRMRIGELSPEAFVWFTGGGLVFLLAACLNLVLRGTRRYRILLHGANLLILAFLIALALTDPRPLGNAGVFLPLLCAALLTATAVLDQRRTG